MRFVANPRRQGAALDIAQHATLTERAAVCHPIIRRRVTDEPGALQEWDHVAAQQVGDFSPTRPVVLTGPSDKPI